MGLLVFMRNLLLALCLFLVLGFLYYSAWKLHLLRWEDSNSVVLSFDSVGRTIGSGRRERKTVAFVLPLSIPSHLAADPGKDRAQKEPTETMAAPGPAIPKYDRLGFLLNLDSRLPPELASKYANFSEGVCKPGYASALMTVIFPKFSKPAPMFLDDSFRKWARIRDFVPPFGIKGQDNLIKAILSATKDYRLTPALDSLSCRRCIIVGNGGVLANKSLGLKIDDYDVVVRCKERIGHTERNKYPVTLDKKPRRSLSVFGSSEWFPASPSVCWTQGWLFRAGQNFYSPSHSSSHYQLLTKSSYSSS